MAKLTVVEIANLKAKTKPYKMAVDRGLIVRVSISGEKTWIVKYMVDGIQYDQPLNKPWARVSDDGHLSLADARTQAEAIRALATEGIHQRKQQAEKRQAELKRVEALVIAETQAQAKAEAENLTVQDMFNVWIKDGVKRKDGNADLNRIFKAYVLPLIGAKPIRELTEHHIRQVLTVLVDRGVQRMAVIVFRNLTQLFKWGIKRPQWRKLLIEGNPMDLIEIDKIVNHGYDMNNIRERKLSVNEIVELNSIFIAKQFGYDNAINKRSCPHPIGETLQRGVWIMLSTMCRVGEMSMARWAHIDFEKATWELPRENVKGELSGLTVYLSEFSLNQFKLLHDLTGDSAWCFPARNTDSHVCVKSMSKQIGDRQSMFKKSRDGSPRKPMARRTHENTLVLGNGKDGAWTPHDLRRTAATMMQSLGISPNIIDVCQNHALTSASKVRKSYQQHEYVNEKTEAWRLLGERLTLILNPINNVLVLNRTA